MRLVLPAAELEKGGQAVHAALPARCLMCCGSDFIRDRVCSYIDIRVHFHMHIHIEIRIRIHLHIYVHIHVHVHVHHVHIHVRIHVHIHVHIQIPTPTLILLSGLNLVIFVIDSASSTSITSGNQWNSE